MILVTTDITNTNRAKPEHIQNKMRKYMKQKIFLGGMGIIQIHKQNNQRLHRNEIQR